MFLGGGGDRFEEGFLFNLFLEGGGEGVGGGGFRMRVFGSRSPFGCRMLIANGSN